MERKISLNKIIMFMVLILTIISCDLKKAEEAFEKGDYVTAVEYSVKYLDKQKKFPTNKESKKILSNLDYIVNYYEKNISQSNSLDIKIENLTNLRKIRILLDNKKYDTQINFFTGKYNINNMGEQLAELYYTKGEEIKILKTEDYLEKAKVYEKGASYYNYKDINQKIYENKFKYADIKAAEYYSAGISAEKQGVYRTAETNFQAAVNVYKDFGKYKDAEIRYLTNNEKADKADAEKFYQKGKSYEKISDYCSAANSYEKAAKAYLKHGDYKDTKTLLNKNDELCRRSVAEKYYNEAKKLEYSARYKYEYREVAKKYNDAYEAYRSYGTYKDSYQKYKDYEEKGKIRVYIADDIDGVIRRGLDKKNVVFTNSYLNSDVKVEIIERRYYREYPEEFHRRDMSERIKTGTRDIQDKDGRSVKEDVYENFSFKEVKKYRRNELKVDMEFAVSGLIRTSNRYRYSEESFREEFYYEGRTPGKYQRRMNDHYRDERNLYRIIESKMKNDIEYYEIRKLADSLDRI